MSKITDRRFISLELALLAHLQMAQMQRVLGHLGKPALRNEAGNVLPLSSGGLSVPLFCQGLQEVAVVCLAPW